MLRVTIARSVRNQKSMFHFSYDCRVYQYTITVATQSDFLAGKLTLSPQKD